MTTAITNAGIFDEEAVHYSRTVIIEEGDMPSLETELYTPVPRMQCQVIFRGLIVRSDGSSKYSRIQFSG